MDWAGRQISLRNAKRTQPDAVKKPILYTPLSEDAVPVDTKQEKSAWVARQINRAKPRTVEKPESQPRKKRAPASKVVSVAPPSIEPVSKVVNEDAPPLRKRKLNIPTPPWTEKHRPRTVAQVVGHVKAKAELQQWIHLEKCYKPLLLCGPTGVGKTSLAHALLNDHGFIPMDCRSLQGELSAIVEQLMFRAGEERVGIVVDEVDNLDAHERTRLVALLKGRRDGVPIICIAEASFDKHIESIKAVCKVVRLYKPLSTGADVRILLARLVDAEHVTPAPGTLVTIETVSNGDMRRATALLELSTRGPLAQRGVYTADVFLDSPFDAATSLMRGMPRLFATIEQAAEVCHADAGMVELLVQENYVKEDGLSMEAVVSQALTLSDVDVLNSHPMHQTHGLAENLLVAATMAMKSRSRRRLEFTTYLGHLTSKKAFRSAAKPVQKNPMDWLPLVNEAAKDAAVLQWMSAGLGMSAKEAKEMKKVAYEKRLVK
jgi:hypothetical protein